MRRKLLSTFAGALVIAGCSSTDNSLPIVNGEFVYPSMPILEPTPYTYDDSKSEALNVVEMAKPAGIGNSLQDHADGKHATIGYIGSSSGLIGAALGLATSGVVGVVQEESTRAGANTLTLFNPTIVDVVEPGKVSINGSPNYQLVRNYLAEKIKDAINASHQNVQWGGVYSIYNGAEKYDLVLVISDEKTCKKAREQWLGDENASAFMTRNFGQIFIDGEDKDRDYCSLSFNINVAAINENNDLVLVAEAKSGSYFLDAIINNYEGYVVVPDYYSLNRFNTVKSDYAYVSNNGKEILFQRP